MAPNDLQTLSDKQLDPLGSTGNFEGRFDNAQPLEHPESPRMTKFEIVPDATPEAELKKESDSNRGPQAGAKEMKGWWLGLAVAVGLIFFGGVLHGQWSNRWGVKPDVIALGEKLKTIPMTIGEWTCQEESKLDKNVEQLLEVNETKAYISRVYVHQSTGEAVNVFVIFGPKGPVAVHTPEVCYSGKDVRQISNRDAVGMDIDGIPGELWKLGFETNGFDKRKMAVYYGWSDGGPWTAAVNPRFWRTDYLYKIQTACMASGNKEDSTDEFFKVFLPELRKQMRSNS